MTNQPDSQGKVEERLRGVPLEKTPARVYDRLQKEASWNSPSSTGPSWPTIIFVTVLGLASIFLPLLFDRGGLESPLPMPSAGTPGNTLPAEAPDHGPRVPPLIAPLPPAPILAQVPISTGEDEQRAYNVRSSGIEPTFQTTFGETAMAPWLARSDS